MTRTYDYEGFTLEVAVEPDVSVGLNRRERAQTHPGYIAVVRIFPAGYAVAVFSPLRFGEAGGRPFATEDAALMGGYSAAYKMVDDLLCHDGH